MIRNLLFLAGNLLLMTSVSMAQPTLTATGINPTIGETFTFYNSSYVSPGSSGANQTWNLSSMTGTSAGLTTVATPSSTSYASSFPNATIAWSNASSTTYYKTSSTALQYCGPATSSVVMSYSNLEDILHYPFTYNNSYSDTWATQFLSSGYTFFRSGTTTVTADGYGTLTTPNGTYTNALRVHYVQVYQDSANIGMPYIITYNNDEYMWYKEGTHVQLAVVYNLTSSSGGPYTGGSYVTGNTGINNLPDLLSSSDLYPNPASDNVTVNYTLTENQQVDVRVFNLLSQQAVLSQTADGIQGENAMQLDVSNLPEGMYFAQIMLNGNVTATKRFVIAK